MTLRMLCLFSILGLLLCAIRFHIEPAATATPSYDVPMAWHVTRGGHTRYPQHLPIPPLTLSTKPL